MEVSLTSLIVVVFMDFLHTYIPVCGWIKEVAKVEIGSKILACWGLTMLSTRCHWLHNANVKFVDLQHGKLFQV